MKKCVVIKDNDKVFNDGKIFLHEYVTSKTFPKEWYYHIFTFSSCPPSKIRKIQLKLATLINFSR